MQSSSASVTDRKRPQDLLTCPVCLQYFDDPRVLPCKHTFCRKCLERHVVQRQRRQPSETRGVRGASTDRHPVYLLPCPLAPSCLHVAVVPAQGVSTFPVDDRIPKLKERVVNQLAEDISRRIHGSSSGGSDSASVLSDRTDLTIGTTCSAPAGNVYDSGDEGTLPSERPNLQTSDSSSTSQRYSKFSRYFEKIDGEPDVKDSSRSSSTARSERRRVGYSASFQHRRKRVDVSSPLAFDDAVSSTREFLRRQPSRSGSAPHLDEEDGLHGGRLRTEKTVRGVHLREPIRRNASIFQSHTSTERVRPTSAILEEILLNSEQRSSSSSGSDSLYRSFRCDDLRPDAQTNQACDAESNKNGCQPKADGVGSSAAAAGSQPFVDDQYSGNSTTRTQQSGSGDRLRFSSSSSSTARYPEYSNVSNKLSDDKAKSSTAANNSDERESRRESITSPRNRRKLPNSSLSSCREGLSSQFTPRCAAKGDRSADNVTSSDNSQSNSSSHTSAAPTESHRQRFSSASRHAPSVDVGAEDRQYFQPRSAATAGSGERVRPADGSHAFHSSHSCSDFTTDYGYGGVRNDTVPPSSDTTNSNQSPLLGRSSRTASRFDRASTTSPLLRPRRETATDGDSGLGHSPVIGRRAFASSHARTSTPAGNSSGGRSPLLGSSRFQRSVSSTRDNARYSSAPGAAGGRAGMNWNGGGGINPESWWNSMSKYLDSSSDDDDEPGTNVQATTTARADDDKAQAAAAADVQGGAVAESSQQNSSIPTLSQQVDSEAAVELGQQTTAEHPKSAVDNTGAPLEQGNNQNSQNQVFLVAGLKPVIVKTGVATNSKQDASGPSAASAAIDSTNTSETEGSINNASSDGLQGNCRDVSPAQNGPLVDGSEPTTVRVTPPPPRELSDFDRIMQAARLKYSTIYEPLETVAKNSTHIPVCVDGITCNWRTQRDDFATPTSLAILSDCSVFIADWSNSSIDCYDGDGSLLHSVTGTKPYSIACLVSGDAERIYVGDRRSKTVRIFDTFGCDVAQWDAEKTNFGWISGIAALRNGNLVIVDRERCKVGVFNTGGDRLLEFGAYGTNDKQLCMADFVGVDSHDRVIIADSGNHCLKLFDANAGGKPIGRWSQRGSEDGCLDWPKGVVVDRNDNVIVADTNNNRICQFADSGQFVGHLVTGIVKPYSVALNAAGSLLGVTQFSLNGFSQVSIYSLGNNTHREQSAGERVIG